MAKLFLIACLVFGISAVLAGENSIEDELNEVQGEAQPDQLGDALEALKKFSQIKDKAEEIKKMLQVEGDFEGMKTMDQFFEYLEDGIKKLLTDGLDPSKQTDAIKQLTTDFTAFIMKNYAFFQKIGHHFASLLHDEL